MITAVVLTKNEEKNIKDCLSGLKWCDEILVVDDNSDDKTRELAQKSGATVIKHALSGDFAAQRNFALNLSKGDWIFFVDADERVSPELAKEIQAKIKKTDKAGFYLRRIDFFMNRWLKHGEIGGWGKLAKGFLGEIGEFGGIEGFSKTGGIKILRLARKNSGVWQRKVDEKWHVSEKTQILDNYLLHYSHLDLSSFLKSINEKSTLNAQRMYQENIKIAFWDWGKPLAKFVWNYFFLLGFLDGLSGFVFAVLMSLHSFLVRGKLYLLWQKTK